MSRSGAAPATFGAFSSSHARNSSRHATSCGVSLKSIPASWFGGRTLTTPALRALASATVASSPFTQEPVDDPKELGIDEAALGDLLDRVQQEVANGILPSCQIALAREGRVAAARTYGAAPDSRYVIFSATKPVVAGAVWVLI